jgi:hypothetical protein
MRCRQGDSGLIYPSSVSLGATELSSNSVALLGGVLLLARDGLQEYRRRVPPMRIQHGGEAWRESMGDCLERREQTRYGLRALVGFEWMDTEGVPQQGQGFTRDISPMGMFIHSDSQPPAKADAQVEVSLHSVVHAVTGLRMRAKGLVIRVEPPTSPGIRRGFAIPNRSCKLHHGAPIGD